MSKYLLPLNLQLFAEEPAADTGVEEAPAAEVQPETTNEAPSSESGAKTEAAAEPEKMNNFEKAFAKRLAAEREKWQQETSERYKDFDAMQKATQYMLKQSGLSDVMSLKEQIEMAELQEQAEKQGISTELLKRLNDLEQKAQKAEQYEEEKKLQQFYQDHRSKLETFAKEKGIDAQALEDFMVEKRVSDLDVAYRAMKFEDAQAERERIEKEAVQKYLESKKAPKVEGTGSAGMVTPPPPKNWDEARERAAAMIRAANTNV